MLEFKIFISGLFVCLLVIIILKKLYGFFNSIFVFINKMNKLYDLFFSEDGKQKESNIRKCKDNIEKQLLYD